MQKFTQLHYSHGHRTVENLKRYVPSLEGDELMREVVRFESRILEIAEENRRRGEVSGSTEGTILKMPGAPQLLAQINMGRTEGRRAGWAIVTSGTFVTCFTDIELRRRMRGKHSPRLLWPHHQTCLSRRTCVPRASLTPSRTQRELSCVAQI